MNQQEQIKALAELDGWKPHPSQEQTYCWYEGKQLKHECHVEAPRLQRYLTSYDAIIPLIHKVLNRHTCHSFFDALGLLAIKDWQDCDGAPSYEGDGSYFEIWVLFKATPQQLCEALLRATRKWIE